MHATSDVHAITPVPHPKLGVENLWCRSSKSRAIFNTALQGNGRTVTAYHELGEC